MAYSEGGGTSRSLNVTITGIVPPVPPPPTPPPPTPPTVICTPGALKCIGPDLYVCNTSGTAWILKQKNSPTCQIAGNEPNFFLQPQAWIAWFFVTAWEALTSFIIGGWKTLLLNIQSFQTNFMAQLVIFIQDPIKALKGWLAGVFLLVASFALEFAKNITVWWTATQVIVKKLIDDAVGTIGDISKIVLTVIDGWWKTAVLGVQTLISAALTGINTFISGFGAAIDAIRNAIMVAVSALINVATSSFGTLLNFATKELYELIIKYINEFVEMIVTGFFSGFTRGINESGQSPLDVDKETDNPIYRDLQLYMKNYRLERDKKKVK